ncbi:MULTISPECIES: 6-phosphogluconolactonase [unclassified Arsukibacterium]|uniref:6-phosphogluconolactonase n=1 Tax=unclassified Arsukibacterium TaxID=2635278 RepID=UPI000C356C61|nr:MULTISPECIES: 6-phosphogluconolactonase [unclassified Arsukibacterium]MAA93886.1 6-phosphogluconolactonase [Rheinheimera sp.]MBM33337.1 6-phosphogluconolactonase [Rheinheimera sp.]HAW94114.1 6-phosphogluconolactonase [Candidatus Azambacteria bacterium]|tara:strand:- start:80568 stop:81257 length:690 start_codon:yes stop_codon:yes gene_type:complete
MKLHQYADTGALNTDFAAKLVNVLQEAIAARGHAYLVVSGGRTPTALFNALSAAHLAWHNVTVLLADERFVPVDAPDSNERLVKANLLTAKAAKANFISLYAPAVSAEEAVADVLPRIADLPVFDAVILGMGEDGHTASLFPCSAELSAGLAADAPAVLAVNPTTAPHQRISLSLPRLLHTRQLFIHLVGPSKLEVLTKAQAGNDVSTMPIRAILQQPEVDVAVMYAAN